LQHTVLHWYLSAPHWRVAKGNKRQITYRNYYRADEILHVTGHEEQNVKKRYSSKQAQNGSECIVELHTPAILPLRKSHGIHCTSCWISERSPV